MACACKVNQQLEYLQRHYGTKEPRSSAPRTHMSGNARIIVHKTLISVMLLILFPVMLLYMAVRMIFFRKKKLAIDKLFRLGRK